MHYAFAILPVAAFAALMGVVVIVFRGRIIRGSNGLYGGLGLKRLVWARRSGERFAVAWGGFFLVIAAGLVVAGFFVGSR